MKQPLLILLFICAFALPSNGADWGPWDASTRNAAAQPQSDLSLLKYGVRFFQRYISRVDGPRCPMTPSCSAYAIQAVDKHGPALGTMLTVDRLLHETDSREHRHAVKSGERTVYRDPLENNDFWLYGE